MANRLADSTSPYLRQHADNPVAWWEWSAAAFEEARRRDVPIFLSVGYAACHWCHVMAHESFEDSAAAEQLNQNFVSIKVDREERPDVDQIYMDVTVALTGQGGWPMSVWLTPEGHAFHAGTYFPPTARPGLPSFRQVLDAVTDAWENRREQVLAGSVQLTTQVEARSRPPAPGTLTAADVDQAVGSLIAQADDRSGGFGDQPKFPPSTILDALLARAAQGDGPVADEAWRVAALTLERMARGGIYDQLGGGFARYATDRDWVVPHFEKMLYDNALLIGCYARGAVEADRRGDPLAGLCERVVAETVEWLTTDLLTEEGAFASSLDADSLDADSKLREGAAYVWTPDQLADVLGAVDGERAARLLGVDAHGSFEHGTSTLQLSIDPDPDWFGDVRDRLRADRSTRPAPARDDKVVAAWNGWAIASIVDAAMLLGHPEWLPVATRAASAVLDVHLDGDRLRRASRDGIASQAHGAADDHAGLALGLLELACATGEQAWLRRALSLLETLEEHFRTDDGGLFDTADHAESLVRRPRSVGENATPSGTTSALRAYRVAHRLTGDDRWRERADALAATVATYVAQAPRAAGWALADAVAEHGPRRPVEVAIVGEPDAAAGGLTATAWREAPPSSVVVTGVPDSGIPLLASRPPQGGVASAYVCRGHVCDLPVTSVESLQGLLA